MSPRAPLEAAARARSASTAAPSARRPSRLRRRLTLGRLGAPQRDQGGAELEPGLGGLEGPAAALEAVDGVLEQRPRPLVVAPARRASPRPRRRTPAARPCRPGARSPAGRRARSRPPPARPRARARTSISSAGIRSISAPGMAQQPLGQLGGPAASPGPAPGGPGRAGPPRRTARGRAAGRRRPSGPASVSAPPARPAGRRPSPGREWGKSSTEASSIASASSHLPRQRCTAPYSARQKASM